MIEKESGNKLPFYEKTTIDNQDVINESGNKLPEMPTILRLIKKLIDAKASQRSIAKLFGVSHTTIQNYIKLIKLYEEFNV